MAKKQRRAMESPEAQKAKLRATAPDIATLVDEGRLSLGEAMAVLAVRQRQSNPYLWEEREQRELRSVLTPEQWREHEAFIKRRDEFNALPQSERVDMARWVLAVDPDLADEVKNGLVPLFEAYHQLKQAEAFLAACENGT